MGQTLNPAAQLRPRGSKRLLALRGDDHLVARVRAGDEVAFEVIYDRYSPALLSFCRHMVGRLDEAEDALQHAFVSAHDSLLRDDRSIELKPWLYAIARNRCLSILRGRRDVPTAELEPSGMGLQDEVQRRADLRELVDDVADLPEQQRAALLLTELDDLSHASAAAVLDCEPSQVKGLVFRARAGLIERRDARAAPCEEIREELSTARRGTLRKGRLKHHLKECPGCSAYLEDVRRQRRMMALILPVIPATGLKRSILAAAGIGGGTTVAGGVTALSTTALVTTAAKVAIVGALVGGAGVAGHTAFDHENARPSEAAPPAAAAKARPDEATRPAEAAPKASNGPRRVSPATTRSRGDSPERKKTRAKSKRGPAKATPNSNGRNNRATPPRGRLTPPGNGPRVVRPVRPKKPRATHPGTTKAPRRGTRARGAPAPAPQAGPKQPQKTK